MRAERASKDWHVAEAASWLLALSEDGVVAPDGGWHNQLPTIKLVDRMRALPLFESVSVAELFRIAAAGHQTRHEDGTTLSNTGAAPRRLHVLLDDEVREFSKKDGSTDTRSIRAPATLGFEETLDGRFMNGTIRAAGAVARGPGLANTLPARCWAVPGG